MSTKDDNGRRPDAPPEAAPATADDRRRFEAAHVEILRRLFASGSDDQIIVYLHGNHLGATASAVANILRGVGDLVDVQTVLTILRTDHGEWFYPDAPIAIAVPAPSVQDKLEAMSEAEARAVLRELREEHPFVDPFVESPKGSGRVFLSWDTIREHYAKGSRQ